ncbi:MAG: DUF2490 domain-containing protein [Acidobacteria bacterium]|nr:DUF2490 domain-containing protein [Acidobacteriota bacterium]
MRAVAGFVVLVVACCVVGPATASAQEVRAWFPTILQLRLADGWAADIELHPRFDDDLADFELFMIRPSISRRVAEPVTLTAGYAWIGTFEGTRHEQRIWQQVVFSADRGPWSLSQRLRLEQRLFEGAPTPSWRLRGQVRASRPVSSTGPWRLSLGTELLWTLNDARDAPPSGWHSHRVIVGLGRPVGRVFIEPAYMLQTSRSQGSVAVDHVIRVTTTLR